MRTIDLLLDLSADGKKVAEVRLNYTPRIGEKIPVGDQEFEVLDLEHTRSDEGSMCGIARVRPLTRNAVA